VSKKEQKTDNDSKSYIKYAGGLWGERASGGKGVIHNAPCSGTFFSELQPSWVIAWKSHNGTVLSAEKKAVLKNIIDMNIDI
jgi:hypothetical protein